GELEDYSPIVARLRPFCVTFSGGEPLLRRDMPTLVAQVAALRPRPYIAVLTNGWLLSTERAPALRAPGCQHGSISIAPIGTRHDDRRRLPGLFARLAKQLPELHAIGFDRININSIIMRSNLHEITALGRLAKEWGVTISFSAYSNMKTKSDVEFIAAD